MRPWALFLAVVAFVYGLLINLWSLVPVPAGVPPTALREVESLRSASLGISLLTGVLYGICGVLLWRFSSAVRHAQLEAEGPGLDAALAQAFSAHRAFWSFVGALVVVLGGVMLLGIGAAILIPNLTAVSGRERRETVVAMRRLGAALESYAQRHHEYPQAGTIQALSERLESDAGETPGSLPVVDGWGQELRYTAVCDPTCTGYRLRSPGADGKLDEPDGDRPALGDEVEPGRHGALRSPQKGRWDPNRDILHADGYFIQAPAGLLEPGERLP